VTGDMGYDSDEGCVLVFVNGAMLV